MVCQMVDSILISRNLSIHAKISIKYYLTVLCDDKIEWWKEDKNV